MPKVGDSRIGSGDGNITYNSESSNNNINNPSSNVQGDSQGFELNIVGNNLGFGEGIYAGANGTNKVTLDFRTLVAGDGISLLGDSETITITNTGVSELDLNSLEGILSVGHGGTGVSTLPVNGLMYGNGAGPVQTIPLPEVSGTQMLVWGGSSFNWMDIPSGSGGSAPTVVESISSLVTVTEGQTDEGGLLYTLDFDSASLSLNSITGVLSVSKGGTGVTSLLGNAIVIGAGTGPLTTISVPSAADQVLTWTGTAYTWSIGGTVRSVGISAGSSKVTVTGGPITTNGSITIDVDPSQIGINSLSGTLTTAKGGTGLTTLGSALSYLRVNSSGTGLEYATISQTSGTVTSVGITAVSSKLSVSNSPITSSGNILIEVVEGNLNLANMGGTLPTTKGGTGLTTLGTSKQVLRTTADATALEYATLTASDISGLATVATSGSYLDLTNRPALSTVATTGLYSDLTGKPVLSSVATSGSYTDLTNKPVLTNGTVTSVGLTAGSTKVSVTGATVTDSGSFVVDVVEANLTLNNIGGTLSATKGGTGLASTTQNGVMIGGPTNSYAFTSAPSTTGSVLTWNGSSYTWTIPAGTGVSSMADGTQGSPGWFFTNDTNTGFYRPSVDTLGFAVGGQGMLTLSSTGLESADDIAVKGSGADVAKFRAYRTSSGAADRSWEFGLTSTTSTSWILRDATANSIPLEVKIGTGGIVVNGTVESKTGGFKFPDGTTQTSAATPYVLPIASVGALGGIRVGSGLSIDAEGILSSTGGGSGTVTSVGLTAGSTKVSVSGSPITTSGSITVDVLEANLDVGNMGGSISTARVTGLATVATSGSYTDLINKPSIPAQYTDSMARSAISVSGSLTYNNISGVISYNAPTLATVATTGSYTDLLNTPAAYSLPIASAGVLGGIKVGSGLAIDATGVLSATASGGGGSGTVTSVGLTAGSTKVTVSGSPITTSGSITVDIAESNLNIANMTGSIDTARVTGLATVAASGSYTDLINKPSIPTQYTDAMARASITLNAGSSGATYNSTTGVLDMSAVTGGSGGGGSNPAGSLASGSFTFSSLMNPGNTTTNGPDAATIGISNLPAGWSASCSGGTTTITHNVGRPPRSVVFYVGTASTTNPVYVMVPGGNTAATGLVKMAASGSLALNTNTFQYQLVSGMGTLANGTVHIMVTF